MILVKTFPVYWFTIWHMLGLTKNLHRRTTRSLLTLLGGLWLLAAAAPCVMAMSYCPPDMSCGGLPMDQLAIGDCDALAAADCRISGVERLVSAVPVVDFSIIPVRLHSLPADAALHLIRVPDRYANVILPPPLNLQHAKLLI